jgi:HD-GYP domain-containing protein (c-di-GMP phosphodiesterase class II)
MIDWFPPAGVAEPDRGLARWHGFVNLRRLARQIDGRDPSTVSHSERVADLAARLAVECGWSSRRAEQLHEAGRVHDVGKVVVPESILLAEGPLRPEEYELVKVHAPVGADVAGTVLSRAQVSWIRHHHERWDGRGYPDGLAAEEIPDGAAILGVADAWDAMTHRPWVGPPLCEDDALAECVREAGHQFAPWAVEALPAALDGSPTRERVPGLPGVPRLRLVTAVA